MIKLNRIAYKLMKTSMYMNFNSGISNHRTENVKKDIFVNFNR